MAQRSYTPQMLRFYGEQISSYYGRARDHIANDQILNYLYLHDFLPDTHGFQILENYFCGAKKGLGRSVFQMQKKRMESFYQNLSLMQTALLNRGVQPADYLKVRSYLVKAQSVLGLHRNSDLEKASLADIDYLLTFERLAAPEMESKFAAYAFRGPSRGPSQNNTKDIPGGEINFKQRQAPPNLSTDMKTALTHYYTWAMPANNTTSCKRLLYQKNDHLKKGPPHLKTPWENHPAEHHDQYHEKKKGERLYWRAVDDQGRSRFDKLLYHTAEPRFRFLFALIYLLGLRIPEAVALQNRHIDLRLQRLSIEEGRNAVPRKTTFHAALGNLFRCFRNDLAPPHSPFFRDTRGGEGAPLSPGRVAAIYRESVENARLENPRDSLKAPPANSLFCTSGFAHLELSALFDLEKHFRRELRR